MKLKARQWILVLLASLLLSSFSLAQERQVQPVKLDKITARLYQILEGSGANGGLYIGDTGVLVIDAKMTKESVGQTLEEVKKITQKPILYLVNTHSDGDHIAGNQFFPQTVTIVSHNNCREEFLLPRRDGTPSEWLKPELAPSVPSLTFRDKMTVYLGAPKVELWYFGVGHTTGDTVVYFPEEKIAFLGDQIFTGRAQLIHSYKGGNSFEHIKTLTKMLETLDAEKFCSGHSEPVDRSAVKQHIEQMKKKQEKIKSLINQGKSLEEIKKEFEESESRLVEAIYTEIKGSR